MITGEKWFTSAGARADIIFVMCANGMFVVPREAPGVEIAEYPALHNHIRYNNVRVPADHLLGPEDGARVLAQRRLGGGRIHHAMRTVAQVKLAFDIMCERAAEPGVARQGDRRAPDGAGGDRRLLRGDQHAPAAGAVDGLDDRQLQHPQARTQIAACKYTCAKVLREVSYRALHIMGSLGTTDLTPLQAMWAAAPAMAIADGVDEVHKVTVARNVLKGYAAASRACGRPSTFPPGARKRERSTPT